MTLAVTEGPDRGLSVRVEKLRTVIGRKGSDLALTDSKVSQSHAAIELDGTHAKIVDLQSRNGLFVNGTQTKEAALSNLDEVRIGLTTIKVMMVEDLGAFKTRNMKTDDLGSVRRPAKRDIGSLIDDELKHFSKWDISQPSIEVIGKKGVLARPLYLEFLEGPEAGRKLKIDKRETTIGRGSADISIQDSDVSRLHASIEVSTSGQALLRDLGSTNGIFVNSKKVTEHKMAHGDKIQLGGTLLRFIAPE